MTVSAGGRMAAAYGHAKAAWSALIGKAPRAVYSVGKAPRAVYSVGGGHHWYYLSHDRETGSWQRHETPTVDNVTAFTTVYACVTLISGDIGKLNLRLMAKAGKIWEETESGAFSPVLKRPNRYQTRQKFIEAWMLSKLLHGNAYVLKQRDLRGVVVSLYVLDPCRVTPLVADDGSVLYRLAEDRLSEVFDTQLAVPASEIIHDTMQCLFHPLVGISPIYACGLPALQGLKIVNGSSQFFANSARPGGILTAPAHISDQTAKDMKARWESNYSGDNAGKIAVLGDGLTFEAISMSAVDAQLIEQLKMSAEMVCSAFHVPAWKVGVGTMPTYQNAQILNQIYYNDCLQVQIEGIEAQMDHGLALPPKYGTEFDLDGLLRMDSATQMNVLGEGVKTALMAPDEGRQKLNLPPVAGGATPYLQQQNFSLAALEKRDAGDPFAKPPPPAPAPAPPQPEDTKAAAALFMRSLKGRFEDATA